MLIFEDSLTSLSFSISSVNVVMKDIVQRVRELRGFILLIVVERTPEADDLSQHETARLR